MIVLDTNVVSELMRAEPDAQVVRWLDAQQPDLLWLTSINVAELLFGLARRCPQTRLSERPPCWSKTLLVAS